MIKGQWSKVNVVKGHSGILLQMDINESKWLASPYMEVVELYSWSSFVQVFHLMELCGLVG